MGPRPKRRRSSRQLSPWSRVDVGQRELGRISPAGLERVDRAHVGDAVDGQPGDGLDGRVPVERDGEDLRGLGEEPLEAVGPAQVGVEPGVVHGQRGAAGELLGQGDVGLVEARGPRVRDGQGHRAERPAPGPERHDDGRAQPEPAHELAVLGRAGRPRSSTRSPTSGRYSVPPVLEHAADARGVPGGAGPAPGQLPDEVLDVRVACGRRRRALDVAARIEPCRSGTGRRARATRTRDRVRSVVRRSSDASSSSAVSARNAARRSAASARAARLALELVELGPLRPRPAARRRDLEHDGHDPDQVAVVADRVVGERATCA